MNNKEETTETKETTEAPKEYGCEVGPNLSGLIGSALFFSFIYFSFFR